MAALDGVLFLFLFCSLAVFAMVAVLLILL
jgi:hypothetical protein